MGRKILIFCKIFNFNALNCIKIFGTAFDIINSEVELK
ncbi:hypothetical protein Cabys_1788 [Caldithrix abyssi DSM 13497]|uniref:Uncharacterized protein n=1 Tax=Caldithrix abyssi DSM 13497 TaxID=880073 RepID=A0A1J1C8D4_CALAY|nr:hypothetical protein Cabys_1788 [Caldithrix abyssi DSM 13497]